MWPRLGKRGTAFYYGSFTHIFVQLSCVRLRLRRADCVSAEEQGEERLAAHVFGRKSETGDGPNHCFVDASRSCVPAVKQHFFFPVERADEPFSVLVSLANERFAPACPLLFWWKQQKHTKSANKSRKSLISQTKETKTEGKRKTFSFNRFRNQNMCLTSHTTKVLKRLNERNHNFPFSIVSISFSRLFRRSNRCFEYPSIVIMTETHQIIRRNWSTNNMSRSKIFT